jgi:hypothetical protein
MIPAHGSPVLSRRSLLTFAGATGVVLIAGSCVEDRPRPTSGGTDRDDRVALGSGTPDPNDVVAITDEVVLRTDLRVAGVVVEPGGHLIFDPDSSVTLESSGNVVVLGRMTMRADDPTVIHRIAFPSVSEEMFVGGGLDVLDSDVGLWVVDDGTMDLAGAVRLPWTRAVGDVAAGADTIDVRDDPAGWQVGDEIVLTPTAPPTTEGHAEAYDVRTIASIAGRTIGLADPVAHDHPAIASTRGPFPPAEVLNLTRNVQIEGTRQGRAHVFIRSNSPQSIRHVQIRQVGPRRLGGKDGSEPVLGRYGLHFHMSHEGSRGSLVEGVVVRECGNHAFVPHMSHGITVRDCVAHDVTEDAYWWDPIDTTDDLLLERCVASLVRSDPPWRGYALSGFLLGTGRGNVARNCIAVGVQGNNTAGGFTWPARPIQAGKYPWTFEDCAAHNNRVLGVYVWQNTITPQEVVGFVAYHNGRSGIIHGAYRNPYTYRDCVLYANGESELEVLAQASSVRPDGVTFDRLVFDGNGLHDYAVTTGHHAAEPVQPVRFEGCEFRGYRRAGFAVDPARDGGQPDWFELVDCVYEGNEFWVDSAAHPDARIQVSDAEHGSITLRRFDQPGTPVPAWNASVS